MLLKLTKSSYGHLSIWKYEYGVRASSLLWFSSTVMVSCLQARQSRRATTRRGSQEARKEAREAVDIIDDDGGDAHSSSCSLRVVMSCD